MAQFLHFFFAQPGQPWYQAAVWGNVVAIVPCGIVGWVWSRTRFWPLRPVRHALEKIHDHHEWHARQTKRLLEHHGVQVDAHPHHDL